MKEDTMKTTTATITENGNGLPSIGGLCYDADTNTVYEIVDWDGSDLISTHAPGVGNSVDVILKERGDASDTTEDEWEEIEASNYGVSVHETEESGETDPDECFVLWTSRHGGDAIVTGPDEDDPDHDDYSSHALYATRKEADEEAYRLNIA